jgi:YD repeat-containing protein
LTYSERGFDENGEPQQKYRYEYNDRGNLTLEEHVVSYNYDGSLKRYEYNSEDKLTRIFYGQATFATYEYDHLGNLTRHDEGGGGVRRKLKHYEYDDQGQLVRYEEYLDEDADPQRDPFNTRLFEYDDRGNLTRYLSTGFPKRNIRYEYDERGNIIRQVAGMYHRSWQYDENSNPVEVIMNRIPIELPYGYGDRIGTYVYDTYGKLIEEKSVFFNEGGPQTETSIYEYDDRGVMTRRTNVRVRGDSDLSYEYTGWGHIFFNPLDDDFGFELPLIFPSYPETPHPVLPIPIIPPDPLKQIRFP